MRNPKNKGFVCQLKSGSYGSGAGSENFNGEGVNALVNKFLQRIIHKAVLGHPAQANEGWATDAHPKMGAKTEAVGPRVSSMSGTLI